MKTYIDLTKGIAFGSGKAHEFKSLSTRRQEMGLTSLPLSCVHSSRRSGSIEPIYHSSAAENHNQGSAKRLLRNLKVNLVCNTTSHFPSQESRYTPLSSILEDLGVDYLGN